MSNGYLIAAEADRDAAHEVAEGFGLDVIDVSSVQDQAATVSALAAAANVGLLLTEAAARDERFVAFARSMGERLSNVQRIATDEAILNTFAFLPNTWPAMSLSEARRRIGLRQGGEAPAEEPRRAEPLPPPEPPPVAEPEETPPVIAQDEAPPEPTPEPEPPVVAQEEPDAPAVEDEPPPPPAIEEDASEEDAAPPPAQNEAGAEPELDAGETLSDSDYLMGGGDDEVLGEVEADSETPEPARKRSAPSAETGSAWPGWGGPAAPAPQAPPPVSAEPPAPPREEPEVLQGDQFSMEGSAPAGGFGAEDRSWQAAPEEPAAPADATAFAPGKLRRGTPELVRIVVHQPKDLQAVIKAARKIDPRTEPAPQGMSMGDIVFGAKVGVSLEVRGAACDGALQRRTWTGEPIDFSFAVEADADVKQVVFLARVFINDAQIGVLAFMRKATGPSKKPASGDRVRLKRHKRVFLSYSSKDRETVSAIATAYQMAGVEHFFDRTSLKSGEEWSPRLRREIDRSDLFHLCWSKSAAESEWVQKEAEHALTRRRRAAKPEITVQMLDGPPWAKHPAELDAINFDDFVRAAIVGYARGDGSS